MLSNQMRLSIPQKIVDHKIILDMKKVESPCTWNCPDPGSSSKKG